MKKFTFSILAALAALVGWPQQSTAATTVKTVDISLWAYYSQTSYAGADSVFSFKDFADALGTDTTTLRTSGKFVYATDIDGNLSNSYTANNMGFWFNAEGVIAAYTNKPVYYVETSVDALKDQFTVKAGQMPNTGAALPTYTNTLFAVWGDKQIRLNITFRLLKRPATNWSTMNFVKTYDVSLDEVPQNSYTAKSVSISLSDVAAALGTDTLTLRQQGENGIWAKDTLGYSQLFTAGDGNFWLSLDGHIATYGTYWKKVCQGGVATDSTLYSWFYVNNIIDTGSDKLTFEVGQWPDSMKAGMKLTTQEFFVCDGKAVTVNLTLNIVEKPVIDWNGTMTEVGHYTYSIDKYATDGYTTTSIAIDLDDMAAKLGIDKATLAADGVIYAIDGGGGQSNSYTATPNPGFWLDAQGVICSWGQQSVFYILYAAKSAQLQVGFYPGHAKAGDTFTTDLYLAYGDKYVKLTVDLNTTEKGTITNPEVVDTYPLEMYAVPSPDTYAIDKTLTVDLRTAAAALGEDVNTFVSNLDVYTVDSLGRYTNNYTCTPNPGFWFDKKNAQNVWGSSPYGVCYATDGTNGVFTFFQMPGKNSVGDTYNPKIYLFDTALNKGVCYSISLSFVATLDSIVDAGGKDFSIALRPDDADTQRIPFSITDFATAVGIPSAELKSATTAYPITLYAPTATGGKTGGLTSDFGFWETASGVACSQSDATCMLSIEYYGLQSAAQPDFDNLYLTLWGDVKDGDELHATLIMCVSDQGALKMYTCRIAVHITDNPDGLHSAIISDAPAGSIYDLQGRRVRTNLCRPCDLPRGIYIKDGKKRLLGQ